MSSTPRNRFAYALPLYTAAAVGLSVFFAASNAYAGEELTSIRSAGMGDNMVAGAGANAALFHNPAGLSLANVYAIELGYDTVLKDGQNAIGLSAADSQTNGMLAGGFAYTFTFDRGEAPDRVDKWSDHDMRAAIALPIIPQALSVGVTGHYMNYNRGIVDTPGGERRKLKSKGLTLDVGISSLLGEKVFLGFVAQNLIHVNGATEGRDLRAGAGFIAGPVRLQGEYGVNLHQKVSTHHAGAGTELMIQGFALRAGYRWTGQSDLNPQRSHALSVGMGYRTRGFGIDAVYRQEIQRAPDRWFGVSMLFFIR